MTLSTLKYKSDNTNNLDYYDLVGTKIHPVLFLLKLCIISPTMLTLQIYYLYTLTLSTENEN